jgi:hypothetical protein
MTKAYNEALAEASRLALEIRTANGVKIHSDSMKRRRRQDLIEDQQAIREAFEADAQWDDFHLIDNQVDIN